MATERRPVTERLRHDHVFNQDERMVGEARTRWVIALTAAMMLVEVGAGLAFGSLALLADGLHMASHSAALGVAAFGYSYARRHAADQRFSFGTGKVNALAGFAGAVLLLAFAALMAGEGVARLLEPVAIDFDHAILVAAAGLLVNLASFAILARGGAAEHGAARASDLNLRSAALHVMADAFTSILAIVALLFGKLAGASWLDPLMGLVGAGLVSHWALGLTRDAGFILLDRQAPAETLAALRRALCRPGDELVDLHVWAIAPGQFAAEAVIASAAPEAPERIKARVPDELNVRHLVVEVHSLEAGR